MKSGHIIIAGAAAIVIGGVAFAFLREAPSESTPATAPTILSSANVNESDAPWVHVDELAANPEGHNGKVLIRGVVAGINQEQGVVALIDSREFEECGTVACATNYLPVRVSGSLPKALSLVQVVGEVTRGENGLEIRAESVEDVQ